MSTYTYDGLAWLTSVVLQNGSTSETTTYTYNYAGLLASEQNGAQSTQYTYDDRGRVVQVVKTELGGDLAVDLYQDVLLRHQ